MGINYRGLEREADAEQRKADRFASTIVIGACIIAAVRLAREQDIGKSTPRLMSSVYDAVSLAKMILDRVLAR